MDEKSALGSQLESFREARRDIEASVLPLATSVDGRRFSFQASLHGLELQAGGYAVLDDGGTLRLGQVLSVELDHQLAGELTLPPPAGGGPVARTELQIRYARGEGIILDGSSAPFHDALIRPAAGSDVQAWQQRETGPLRAAQAGRAGACPRGALRGGRRRVQPAHVPVRPVRIGQDLLARRDPRAAPDRDGPAHGDPRPELGLRAPGRGARRRGPGAGRALPSGGARSRGLLRRRPGRAKAPAARGRRSSRRPRRPRSGWTRSPTGRSTPRWRRCSPAEDPPTIRGADRKRSSRGAHGSACASSNLGVDRYSVWAPGESGSVLDAVHDPSVRCVVIDLGSLPTPRGAVPRRRGGARRSVAAAPGARSGPDRDRRGAQRLPGRAARSRSPRWRPSTPSRIAAEGRKFGLYLLLSTQRPQKIPENVLSQADNLVLMRLNSLADAAFARGGVLVRPAEPDRALGHLPPGRGPDRGQDLARQPALLRFGARITEEGGADVPATWAAPPLTAAG